MTDTTPDYAGLSRRLGALAYHIQQTGTADGQDAQTCLEVAEALRALLESNAALERERDEFRSKLSETIDWFLLVAERLANEMLEALTAGKPEQVPSEAEAERERIAKALEEEADTTPCSEDAVVVRDCARLVRANFSYEEAERLASTTADIAAPKAGGGDA